MLNDPRVSVKVNYKKVDKKLLNLVAFYLSQIFRFLSQFYFINPFKSYTYNNCQHMLPLCVSAKNICEVYLTILDLIHMFIITLLLFIIFMYSTINSL